MRGYGNDFVTVNYQKRIRYNEITFVTVGAVCHPEKVEEMTVNLKAPIIINNTNNKAIQVICDNSDYEIKHKVYGDLQTVIDNNKQARRNNVSFIKKKRRKHSNW